jgi:hypothetical protein
MWSVTDVSTEPLRCSAWSRENQVSPIGTAGSYRGYLLAEVRQPWPHDISETSLISSIREITEREGLRVQAMLDPTARGQRVMAYLNPLAKGFSGFVRHEGKYGDDFPADVTALLQEGDSGAGAPAPAPVKDVLVCIHGRRDFCCGSKGAELAVTLSQQDLPDGVRVWRTSHTGGHRFAPNVIVLPEGTLWAYADEKLVDRVLTRSGPVDDVLDHYRGCAGLSSPKVQAVEREVFREVGWGLLDMYREGTTNEDGLTRLTVHRPDGSSETWEAEVTPGRTVPVPDCGHPIEEAKKSETELVVTGLRRASGG